MAPCGNPFHIFIKLFVTLHYCIVAVGIGADLHHESLTAVNHSVMFSSAVIYSVQFTSDTSPLVFMNGVSLLLCFKWLSRRHVSLSRPRLWHWLLLYQRRSQGTQVLNNTSNVDKHCATSASFRHCAALTHSRLRSSIITWQFAQSCCDERDEANPVKYLEQYPLVVIPPSHATAVMYGGGGVCVRGWGGQKNANAKELTVKCREEATCGFQKTTLKPQFKFSSVCDITLFQKEIHPVLYKMKEEEPYFTLQNILSTLSGVYIGGWGRLWRMPDLLSWMIKPAPLHHLSLSRLWEDVWHQMPRLWL